MPRAVLVQVKRQMLRFEFRQCFWFVSLQRIIQVCACYARSLDEGGFMAKMGSFVR
jgi:hypothetical protein